MTIILAFGDSITQGFWDPEGGWVSRLRKDLDKKSLADEGYYSVFNLGISGDTSKDLLERIEPEMNARLKDLEDGEDSVIMIFIGSNDAIVNNETKKNLVSIDEFKKNVKSFIKIAEKKVNKILFVGITAVDEKRTDPYPLLPGHSCKNEFIEKYDKCLREICKEKKIDFIELYDKFLGKDNLLEDGDHPNVKGHELIYKNVKDYLTDKRIVS